MSPLPPPEQQPPLEEGEAVSPQLPALTKNEVMQCQFSNWYDTFRSLEWAEDDDEHSTDVPKRRRRQTNVTIKSVIIPLPINFKDYLCSDGVRLPRGATRVSSFVPNEDDAADVWSTSSSSSESENENQHAAHADDDASVTSSSDAASLIEQFHFPQLNQQIEHAIAGLGGSVVPKLNWSSPKDATWVNNGTLQCQTAGDVYLLLKSSDFVMHDVLHAFDDVIGEAEHGESTTSSSNNSHMSYELVLRKWCNLHPSMEFRCFVWNKRLLAVSQRNHTQHFAHLVRDEHIFLSQLLDFFETVIRDRFSLLNYCFDVYIDKKERVWLLDFNVWHHRTDALLYTWEELMAMTEDGRDPSIRVVETELEVQQDPLASYRAPIDAIDLASSKKFEEFMKLCEKPSERES